MAECVVKDKRGKMKFSEGRWLLRVAQTEDSPVDVNLDAAAAWGGPIATHARAPVKWPLPPRF